MYNIHQDPTLRFTWNVVKQQIFKSKVEATIEAIRTTSSEHTRNWSTIYNLEPLKQGALPLIVDTLVLSLAVNADFICFYDTTLGNSDRSLS